MNCQTESSSLNAVNESKTHRIEMTFIVSLGTASRQGIKRRPYFL